MQMSITETDDLLDTQPSFRFSWKWLTNERKYPVRCNCVYEIALLMLQVREEFANWFEMIKRHTKKRMQPKLKTMSDVHILVIL